MILSTDNYQRIYEQMIDERDAVRYYISKNEKKMERICREKRSVPCYYYEAITMPKTSNRYLLYYYAANRNEIAKKSWWTGAPLLMNDENGRRVAIMLRHMSARNLHNDTEEPFMGLQVYSGHFFSRYRERMGFPESLPTDALITAFFGRNEGYFAELDYDQIVLEKNRQKGNRAYGIDDGVLLTEVTTLDSGLCVFKHNTFLSRSELKKDQKGATPSRNFMRACTLLSGCLRD